MDAAVQITDPARPADTEERVVRHVIDGNLAVVPIGRYGLTYQFVPTRHHALVVTAFRQTPGFIDLVNGGLLGAGGEIGWRLYNGSRGPTGLFIGLSALAAYHMARDVRRRGRRRRRLPPRPHVSPRRRRRRAARIRRRRRQAPHGLRARARRQRYRAARHSCAGPRALERRQSCTSAQRIDRSSSIASNGSARTFASSMWTPTIA